MVDTLNKFRPERDSNLRWERENDLRTRKPNTLPIALYDMILLGTFFSREAKKVDARKDVKFPKIISNCLCVNFTGYPVKLMQLKADSCCEPENMAHFHGVITYKWFLHGKNKKYINSENIENIKKSSLYFYSFVYRLYFGWTNQSVHTPWKIRVISCKLSDVYA